MRHIALLLVAIWGVPPAAAFAQDRNDVTIVTGRDGPYVTTHMGIIVEADADTVWEIVGDWDLSEMPAAFEDGITITGRDVGALRTIVLKPEFKAAPVIERLEKLDPVRRSYTYSLVDSGMLPWARYSGTIEVQAHGPNRSIIFYEARGFPVGQSHSEASAISIENNLPWLLDVARRFAK